MPKEKKAKESKKEKAKKVEFKGESQYGNPEIDAARAKEAEEDAARGPIEAHCVVCGIDVEVPHLRKNGCPKCGHSGLRAK